MPTIMKGWRPKKLDVDHLWPEWVQKRRDWLAYKRRAQAAMLGWSQEGVREAAGGGASDVEGVRSRCVVAEARQ